MSGKSKKHNRSLKKTLQLSYIFLICLAIIPTIYSIIFIQIHTNQYNNIITNVSYANQINQIAKTDIPTTLWEIVCGKKSFYYNNPDHLVNDIFTGISIMEQNTKSKRNKEKLEVAYRACTTLNKNIKKLEKQMNNGSSVTENEELLDEIRNISALFSDIMQDFILSEIESASVTNNSIKKYTIILTILQIIIITLAISISINRYLIVSKSVREPLADMEKLSTEIAHGNLTARTTVPMLEELIPLANNLNLMAERIDLLIKENIEEQKNFQKAEMKSLQAQITPHFLYNTFDTIIWLAEQEETERVVQITKAFSDFLRISLSRGHEWITVREELEHIRNYLTIQKIRYADILNYEIIVSDEKIEKSKIIKLVLQPLVENAIYHGIKNKRGRGHLKVIVDYTDESHSAIQFTVTDDGAGFTSERLEEVKKELISGYQDAEKLTSVYGVYNVHKKLQLYYGEKNEGLKIESEHNKGSNISFVIPCIFEELSGEQNV